MFTLTDRQWEFGQRTGSRSLIPVIVPIYLDNRNHRHEKQSPNVRTTDAHTTPMCHTIISYVKYIGNLALAMAKPAPQKVGKLYMPSVSR